MYVTVLSLLLSYLSIMFDKGAESITGQESNQLAYDASYLNEGFRTLNPERTHRFFMGFRLVDSLSGETIQGSSRSV